jgi:hypothetical protein
MAGERVEARGPRAVADGDTGRDPGGRTGDLRVRDAEQHRVHAVLRARSATERAVDREAGLPERGGQRRPEPSGADDRACAEPFGVAGGHGEG